MNEGVLGFPARRLHLGPTVRAAIKFDGTAVPSAGNSFAQSAIKFAFNVEKVVFSATGQFTVHFAEAMPDANFVALGLIKEGASNGLIEVHASDLGLSDRKQFRTINLSATNTNFSEVHILFFA